MGATRKDEISTQPTGRPRFELRGTSLGHLDSFLALCPREAQGRRRETLEHPIKYGEAWSEASTGATEEAVLAGGNGSERQLLWSPNGGMICTLIVERLSTGPQFFGGAGEDRVAATYKYHGGCDPSLISCAEPCIRLSQLCLIIKVSRVRWACVGPSFLSCF